MIVIRISGSMRMRMTDEEILNKLTNPLVEKFFGKIKSGDCELAYLKTNAGMQKKNAIVFVHGSPGSLDAFVRYMEHDSLLEWVDLITYDRPGYGESNFGHTINSLQQHAIHLLTLMDSLGYERYWLVGHSYGGPVILQAAMEKPDAIAGLCIIAGSVVEELEPKSPWRKWIDLPLIRDVLPTVLRVSNEELMTLKEDLNRGVYDWKKVTMPVLLMHGTKDVLVPFENVEMAEGKLTEARRVRKMEFGDENHFIVWTHREQVVKGIMELLRDSM